MKGVLQGTVGKTLSVRTLTGGPIVILDDFTVEKTFDFTDFTPGAAPAYAAGQHVALAVPGGHTGSRTTNAEDTSAPRPPN